MQRNQPTVKALQKQGRSDDLRKKNQARKGQGTGRVSGSHAWWKFISFLHEHSILKYFLWAINFYAINIGIGTQEKCF
jgi:hypothetical protein